jgi:hypothetical protein
VSSGVCVYYHYFNLAIHVLKLIKHKLDINPIMLMCMCALMLMVVEKENGINSMVICAPEMSMQNNEY